jgi:hypothetical protein
VGAPRFLRARPRPAREVTQACPRRSCPVYRPVKILCDPPLLLTPVAIARSGAEPRFGSGARCAACTAAAHIGRWARSVGTHAVDAYLQRLTTLRTRRVDMRAGYSLATRAHAAHRVMDWRLGRVYYLTLLEPRGTTGLGRTKHQRSTELPPVPRLGYRSSADRRCQGEGQRGPEPGQQLRAYGRWSPQRRNRRESLLLHNRSRAAFRRRRPQTVRNLSTPLVIGMTVSTAVRGRLAS